MCKLALLQRRWDVDEKQNSWMWGGGGEVSKVQGSNAWKIAAQKWENIFKVQNRLSGFLRQVRTLPPPWNSENIHVLQRWYWAGAMPLRWSPEVNALSFVLFHTETVTNRTTSLSRWSSEDFQISLLPKTLSTFLLRRKEWRAGCSCLLLQPTLTLLHYFEVNKERKWGRFYYPPLKCLSPSVLWINELILKLVTTADRLRENEVHESF